MDSLRWCWVSIVLVALAGVRSASSEVVGREITLSELPGTEVVPAVAYGTGHDEFLAVWQHDPVAGPSEILGVRLDRFGSPIASFVVSAGPVDRISPAVAYDPQRDRFLVVWSEDYWGDGSDWDLMGRFVPWSGPDPGEGAFTILGTTTSQWSPSVAFSTLSSEYLVVWNELSAAPASIRGIYVDSEGLTGSAFPIAEHATLNRTNPDVAAESSTDEFLVVFERQYSGPDLDIAGAVVWQGAVGAEVEIAGWSDAETSPAVATCPGQYQWVVAWQNSESHVYVRFLTGSGVVDGAPIQVSNEYVPSHRAPALACLPGGARYLVLWEIEYYPAPTHFGIQGRCVSWSKEMSAPSFAVRTVWYGQTRDASFPAVAGAGHGWSAVWTQEREGSTASDIHGSIVWGLFGDDFESHSTEFWTATVP